MREHIQIDFHYRAQVSLIHPQGKESIGSGGKTIGTEDYGADHWKVEKIRLENPKPFIIDAIHGGNIDQTILESMPTITGKHGYGIIAPTLIQYHFETVQRGFRGQAIKKPIMTVDGSNRYGLVTSFLHKYYDSGYKRKRKAWKSIANCDSMGS